MQITSLETRPPYSKTPDTSNLPNKEIQLDLYSSSSSDSKQTSHELPRYNFSRSVGNIVIQSTLINS